MNNNRGKVSNKWNCQFHQAGIELKRQRRFLANTCLALLIFAAINVAIADESPTGIDQAMYFKSHVGDADFCKNEINVKGQQLSFNQVSSPALSCPDAFAWKQFLEAVKSEFWKNWYGSKAVRPFDHQWKLPVQSWPWVLGRSAKSNRRARSSSRGRFAAT